MGRAEIEAALDRIMYIHGQFEALSASVVAGWEREYLEMRRALQEQSTLLARTDEDLRLSDEDRRNFREALGKMRSVTALHQAEWPVVSIVQQDPAYRDSIAGVAQAFQHFAMVTRGLLARQPRLR